MILGLQSTGVALSMMVMKGKKSKWSAGHIRY